MSEFVSPTPQTITSTPTDTRHFRWNDDYIELLAYKLDLQKVRNLVDIGRGLDSLAGLFGLYMGAGSTVHGFSRDPLKVASAQAQSDAHPFSVHFKFNVAEPCQLPLADAMADLAVCQHVLMNEQDPKGALAEMCRVVRPGGRVVAFEPNRLARSLVFNSAGRRDLETRLRLVRYQSYYELGKKRLGQGDDSIGDQLPSMFLEAGLQNVEVRLSDKTMSLVPPYDSDEKRARVHEIMSWLERYKGQRELLLDCFLAGGGSLEEFEAYSAWELDENERVRQQIEAGTFVMPGGNVTYIVIGQKP